MKTQSLYRCQCGATLTAQDLALVNEIAAECVACDSRYVVDRSGAGEELPCRCGETITVPTVILVEASVEPNPQESADEVHQREAEDHSSCFDGEAERDFEVPEEEMPKTSKPLVRMPIVAFPELHQIESSAPLETNSITNDVVVADLPIVAAPDLIQISFATAGVEDGRNSDSVVDQEAIVERECPSAQLTNLPIIGPPTLYQIAMPAIKRRQSNEALGVVGPKKTDTSSGLMEAEDALTQANRAVERDEPVAETSGNADPAAISESAVILCPGCKREYAVMKAEMGQTAECECGFVFVLMENTDAVDSAFCSDLMPFRPLAIDRTSERTHAKVEESSVATADAPTVNAPNVERKREGERRGRVGGDRLQSRRRFRYSWIVWIAAGFLLMTFTIQSVFPFRSGEEEGETAARSLPRPISGPRSISGSTPTAGPTLVAGPTPAGVHTNEPGDAMPEHLAQPGLEKDVNQELSAFLGPVKVRFEQLQSQETHDRDDLSHFHELIAKLDVTGVQFSVRDLFWLADCWEKLADRSTTGDLAAKCYGQAAGALALSQTLKSITSPERESAESRRKELTRKSRSIVRVADNEGSEESAGVADR